MIATNEKPRFSQIRKATRNVLVGVWKTGEIS